MRPERTLMRGWTMEEREEKRVDGVEGEGLQGRHDSKDSRRAGAPGGDLKRKFDG